MSLLAALLVSLACLRNTLAVPVPDIDAAACTDIKYTVDKAEKVVGQTFLSDLSCKNDFSADKNGRCNIGPTQWRHWAVIPLVSKNLVGAGSTYNLSQIADDANGKLGYADAVPGQLTGGPSTFYCDKALECGLTVTPQYVHVTGTRSFGASCNAPQPSDAFEMWLPLATLTAGGTEALITAARCYKGNAPTGETEMAACPSSDAWSDQVVPNILPAGTFAKLDRTSSHGQGYRFSIRFNSDNTKFGIKGQTLLNALNDKVYKAGAATAYAGNWQEWSDGLSDIAEFNFDAPDGTTLSNTCAAVSSALESVSGIGDSGSGICD
ncbi:hypothetical protein G7Y79_00062g093640 [Physcia stellaris]|nr:hypothetical protein G7Y79_00062g093640 [Physcia stellaris]